MDDSKPNSGQGRDGVPQGDRPETRPAQPPPYIPAGSPPQAGAGQSSSGYPPPPPPPPAPRPYSAQPPAQGQAGYPTPDGYGAYNQPTEVYPVQGQEQGPGQSRYEQPTEAYPQAGYGPVPGQYQGQGQGYPPQGAYPPQYGPPVVTQPPLPVARTKKGPSTWAWLIPLLLVLLVGAGLITWSVLQNQENERKAQVAATATAQAQATATAAQAVLNSKATVTSVAQKTATAVKVADNKHSTSTAQVQGTATAKAQATAAAADKTALAVAIAAQTSTAVTIADISDSETATAIAANNPVGDTPTPGETTGETGTIQNVSVDYDITKAGQKGMLIHVKFTVDNVKDVPCQVTAYFYYNTGEPVKDTDGTFNTVDNQAAISAPFNPGFDSTIYNDFQLFMPYTQLEIAPGKYDLKFQVQPYILNPYKLLASSEYVDFKMTK